MEDEKAVAWALAQRFEEEGYRALTASSAEEALRMLRIHPCELVISDVRLPGMSGVDLIRRLVRRRRAVPVIAITAHGTPHMVREVLGAGALQCYLKPFQVDQLVDGVQQALRGEAA